MGTIGKKKKNSTFGGPFVFKVGIGLQFDYKNIFYTKISIMLVAEVIWLVVRACMG